MHIQWNVQAENGTCFQSSDPNVAYAEFTLTPQHNRNHQTILLCGTCHGSDRTRMLKCSYSAYVLFLSQYFIFYSEV